uniref:histone acetyltransferase n=1 Tax=Fopius arisanus TaxID=64838 RepID=A0A0C9PPC8_9HYME
METNNNKPEKCPVVIDLEEEDEIIELPPPNTSLQQDHEQTSNDMELKDTGGTQRKAIQQCLALLLHAQRCDILQEESSEVQIRCVQPHCSSIKDLLIHQNNCQKKQKCSVPRCSSSKMILRHWENCRREDCPLCSPLRKRFNVQLLTGPNQPQEINKKSKDPSLVGKNSEENRFLLNPFASPRTIWQTTGESWDDDPIVVVRIPERPIPTRSRKKKKSSGKTSGNMNNCNLVTESLMPPKKWRLQKITSGEQYSRENKGFKFRNSSDRRIYFSEQTRGFHPKSLRQPSRDDSGFDSRAKVPFPKTRRDQTRGEPQKTDHMKERQDQMLRLVHAFDCRRKESQGLSDNCIKPSCTSTKHLLEHMKNCERTLNCWIPNCISSKRILIHINECKDEVCEMCAPLTISKRNSTTGTSSDV